MQARSDTRLKYGIDSSVIVDCCFTLCLNLCSSTQVYRELKGRGEPVELFAEK